MRSFKIPEYYHSPIIARVKDRRKNLDPRKLDFSPTVLDFGAVKIQLARHFGFCFGVENAIEISYKAIAENPGKRIFLLSQMIHNPEVNEDLESRGVKFLHDTNGNELTPLSEVSSDDIVIVPAFGTTLEMMANLSSMGIDIVKYNTTCPFVERVWKRSSELGKKDYTVIIHGKPDHEETRATFSHAESESHALIVSDYLEAEILKQIMEGTRPTSEFYDHFQGRTSVGFDPSRHLSNIGVVNQTTMIAAETQSIAELLKSAVGVDNFANTRDTLCYATNDNQRSTIGALKAGGADIAIVVGGYNSSNTSHIVEICEKQLPTYFVRNELEFENDGSLNHFNVHSQKMDKTEGVLDQILKKSPSTPTILITSGASCPDASMERVLLAVLSSINCEEHEVKDVEDVLKTWGA
jgi:4-hydroxy-3-methylbut-2-enyl diphosphate reductase